MLIGVLMRVPVATVPLVSQVIVASGKRTVERKLCCDRVVSSIALHLLVSLSYSLIFFAGTSVAGCRTNVLVTQSPARARTKNTLVRHQRPTPQPLSSCLLTFLILSLLPPKLTHLLPSNTFTTVTTRMRIQHICHLHITNARAHLLR